MKKPMGWIGKSLCAAALSFCACTVTAATRIWYRMDGEPGEIVFNKAVDGTVTSVDRTLPNAASPGAYEGIVKQYNPSWPGKAVFDGTWYPQSLKVDGTAYTNTSSLYIGPADFVPRPASAVQFRAYGGYIQVPVGDGGFKTPSFTAEIVYQVDREVTAADNGFPRYFINCCGGYLMRRTSLTYWEVQVGTNAAIAVSGLDDLDQNAKWHHLAITYDGATSNLAVWVDYVCKYGPTVQPKGLAYGVVGQSGYAIPTDLLIGNGATTAGHCFSGWYDEFRLSDEALTPDRFLDLQPDTLDPHEPDETLLRYRMGDYTEDIATMTNACGWMAADAGLEVVNMADPTLYPLVYKEGTTALEKPSLTNQVFSPICCAKAGQVDGMANASAFHFDKTAKNWCDVTLPEGCIVSTNFTAECIFKSDGLSSGALFRQRVDGSTTQISWGIRQHASGVGFDYGIVESGGTWTGHTTVLFPGVPATVWSDQQWHHAAVVYDRAALTAELWFDYVLRGTIALPNALPSPTANLNQFLMGMTTGAAEFYNGVIDEVRVTRKKLGKDDFLTFPLIAEDALFGHWRFDGDFAIAPDAGVALDEGTPTGGEVSFSDQVYREKVYNGAEIIPEHVLSTNQATAVFTDGVVDVASKQGLFAGKGIEWRAFTAECFYKSGAFETGMDAYRWLLFYQNPDNADRPVWALRENENGSLQLFFRSSWDPLLGHHLPSGEALALGKWRHVAVTVEEVVKPENVTNISARLYVDYNLYQSYDGTGSSQEALNYPVMYGANGGTLRIGGGTATTQGYRGSIDEVRVSSGILVPSQFLRQSSRMGLQVIFR